MNILYFGQFNASITLPYPFLPTPFFWSLFPSALVFSKNKDFLLCVHDYLLAYLFVLGIDFANERKHDIYLSEPSLFYFTL
jgi:hypothetical protein